MLVEVRPIQSTKWHGKKGQESFTRPKKLQALANAETMQYATGLTEEDREKLKNKPYEFKQDLSPQFNPELPHPFWDSPMATIKLENNTQFFNTELPLDYIKIKIMKASKYVANSMREYEEGLYPEAHHVIHDEMEEAELSASKIALENQAVIEVSKLSKDKKIELILILGGKNLKGQSDNFVTVAMAKKVKEDPEEVLRYIKMDSKDVATHAIVLEALQKSVLKKEGHRILYHDALLGNDIHDVIDYLNKDENQDLRLRIMKAINS
jgi:hypothetical protein